MESEKAHVQGSFYIVETVVNKQTVSGLKPVAVEKNLKDFRIGFNHSLVTTQNQTIELIEKWKAPLGQGKSLRGPITQGKQAKGANVLELAEEAHHGANFPLDHLGPSFPVETDFTPIMGVGFAPFLDPLGEWEASIEAGIPL